MAFDAGFVTAVIDELNHRVIGSKIEKIFRRWVIICPRRILNEKHTSDSIDAILYRLAYYKNTLI